MLRTDLMKEMDDKSTSHMVEVSDEEGNDGHQVTSPIQMKFVNNYQNIGVVDFDVDNRVYFTLLIVYIKLYNLSLTYFSFKKICLRNTD